MLLCGLIIHAELIIREVYNPDTAIMGYHYIAGNWDVSLGRWLLLLITRLRFGLSTPVYSTFASLIIRGIAILFVIDLLDIKKKSSKILLSLILLALPSFMGTLTYFYCADAYQFSLLFACLMAWSLLKIKNRKIGLVISSIFVLLSASIYQSYIGVALGLCLIFIILNLFRNKEEYKIKNGLIDVLYAGISFIVGMILYAICSKIVLYILNVSVSTYSGANNISIINIIKNLPQSILAAYKTFLSVFLNDSIVQNSFYYRKVIYICMFILLIIMLLVQNIKNKRYKELLFQCVLLIILPIAFNIIRLIAVEREMNIIMITATFFIIVLFIAMMEEINLKTTNILSTIILIIIIQTYIVATNASYVALDLTKHQTMDIAQRILDRVQEYELYDENTRICIVGSITDYNFPRNNDIYQMTIGKQVDWGYFWDEYELVNKGWYDLYNRYFGYNINLCSEAEYISVITSNEFKEMSMFPKSESIKEIGDVLVVKLTDIPPIPDSMQ